MAYGWEGKGSPIHLVTEGNGLPLAFLVTAANIAEVSVRLKVTGRVRVPRPQGRPKQLPACLGTDQGYGSAAPDSIGTAAADSTLHTVAGTAQPTLQAVLKRSMKSASSAGKWSGVVGGWTTGSDWLLSMTGTPNPTSLF